MPFVQINISKEIEKEKQRSPEFKKAWEESREEYRLIGESISVGKRCEPWHMNSVTSD